jgi:hypothetical protein
MTEHSLAAQDGEYLDPGYDTGTPHGDNLLTDFFRAEVEGWQRWATAGDGRYGHDQATGVAWVDTGCASVFGNPSHWSRPVSEREAPTVVQDLAGRYGAGEGGPFVVFSAFPTPDLRELGMAAVGHPPLMARPAGRDSSVGAAEGLRIERVASQQQLLDFERTIVEAFPVDELLPWRAGGFVPAGLLHDDAWFLYVGYAGGRPVATSAAFVTDQIVDVTWVSCQSESRRRGYGEAMTWAAMSSDRTKPAMLIASDDGRPVYERMGYATLLRITLWIGSRPAP